MLNLSSRQLRLLIHATNRSIQSTFRREPNPVHLEGTLRLRGHLEYLKSVLEEELAAIDGPQPPRPPSRAERLRERFANKEQEAREQPRTESRPNRVDKLKESFAVRRLD